MASEEAGSVAEPVQCPVCFKDFAASEINAHLDRCLLNNDSCPTSTSKDMNGPPLKKPRISSKASSPTVNTTDSSEARKSTAPPSPIFRMFQTNINKGPVQSERNTFLSNKPIASTAVSKGTKRHSPDEMGAGKATGQFCIDPPASNTLIKTPCDTTPVRALLNIDKPLAEKLRPTTLEEYFGQNKVVGEHTLLRSLLDSQEIPSLILWGPPGCGKTTLAHIIASGNKKRGTARFVSLSATSTSTNEVREVIKQAQNELKLMKRKTILFIDEIHRFNKSQQDTFLPHVECGTVTLIGATTENPSFQVNAALLSRCRVLVLDKLSVEAMGLILLRAVATLGISVLGEDLSDRIDQDELDPTELRSEPKVYIEQKALDTIAHLCDGDARAGLNGLQLAVQARVGAARPGQSGSGSTPHDIVVQEEHVKEGLQRSHILYDKAGMADPSALPQAVSAFQACHLIGMPECEVILAQCVVYLARAPKSVEIYKAYGNVKASLRNHKGPLPSVPLHLRNAPTKLMKDLGYAEGYKYNPAFSAPVEQDYLPEELRGMDFFTWNPSDL
uniref:ATPase WRNIP1 isoform X2 n=1 Tax=Oncorhynchus gorbuscha TaxID=8017 RepID=UPI001EAE9C31|nr:ATPase WRNIP1 isoform X2 [Oncorhynchus gorbuscha]